jgi:23S rRNA (cytidine1920-2'-O)/16S rRNA (cytidine1409-2'-O)-methyltransferase
MKTRLDLTLFQKKLTSTRSQAKSYIKLGYVKVNSEVITKSGYLVNPEDKIEITAVEQYVSRAALKLASVADKLRIDFKDKVVLDVGSSTGGFTDFALKHSAQKVIAVDVGTNQLHPSLHGNPKIELHEQTDIRDFASDWNEGVEINIVVIDASFISLREILPCIAKIVNQKTEIVAMVKPQFEAGAKDVNKGVIKNDSMRRKILKDFELWTRNYFKIIDKADSEVAGAKGNLERFYLLKTTPHKRAN